MTGTVAILLLIFTTGCLYGSLEWSPDGRQLAFVAQAGDADEIFPEGWLWRAGSVQPGTPDTRRQVWVADTSAGQGHLIDETSGIFSSPCWSPRGESLAYVAFTEAEPQEIEEDPTGIDRRTGTLELIHRQRDGQRRVVVAESGSWPVELLARLPGRTPAWSPDGEHIAFPWVGSASLRVVNLVSGQVVADWLQGDLPSWSPVHPWLAFYERGIERGFRIVHTQSWTTDIARIPSPAAFQPAIWESGGDAILILRLPTSDRPERDRVDFAFARRIRPPRLAVVRIQIPDKSDRVLASLQRPGLSDTDRLACFIAHHDRSEMLVASIISGASPPQAYVIDTSTGTSREGAQDLIVGQDFPIASLSYSPTGDSLAFRYGIPDWSSPPAIWRPVDRSWRTLAPTMALRMRALANIVAAIENPLRNAAGPSAPRSGASGKESPAYRELFSTRNHPLELFDLPDRQRRREHEQRSMIDRLTQEGLRLIDDAPDHQKTPTVDVRLAEIELLLRYAQRDYRGALSAADRIVQRSQQPVPDLDQLALDLVRLQCLVGEQRLDAARWEVTRLARAIDSAAPEKSKADLEGAFGHLIRERLWQIDVLLSAKADPPNSESTPSDSGEDP